MTPLLILFAFVVLDVLALRFGYDSRGTKSDGLWASWTRDRRH